MDGPSSQARQRRRDRIKATVLAVVLIGVPLALIVLPDWITVRFTAKRWQLTWCGVIDLGGRESFVAHLTGMGSARAPSYSWLAVLDPRDGKLLGERLVSGPLQLLGIDGDRLWVGESGRDHALALPGLEDASSAARPASFKRLSLGQCNAPRSPRKLAGRLVLDGRFVCDRRTGGPVDLGGADRLLAHQTLEGEQGKLILTRLSRQGRVWTLPEQAWAGRRGPKQPGYRVVWASRVGESVVLVLPVAHAAGALHLVGLDPGRGRLSWRRSAP